MIFCNKIKDLLIDYLDNQVDLETKKIIKSHLAICEECKNELAFLRLYKLDMCSLEKMNAPLNFMQDVHKRLQHKENFSTRLKKLIMSPKIRHSIQAGFALVIIFTLYFTIRPFWLANKDKEIDNLTTKNNEIKRNELTKKETAGSGYDDTKTLNGKLQQSTPDLKEEESMYFAKDKDSASLEEPAARGTESKGKILASREKQKEEILMFKDLAPKKNRSKDSLKNQSAKKDRQILALNEKRAERNYPSSYKKSDSLEKAEITESEKINKRSYKFSKNSIPQRTSEYDYDKDVYDTNISVKYKKIKEPKKSLSALRDKAGLKEKSKKGRKRKSIKSGRKTSDKRGYLTRDTLLQIKKLVRKYNGKLIVNKYKSKGKENSYIILEIPTEKYNLFIKKLADIVYINKSPSPKKTNKKRIRLKIKFLN